MKKYKLVVTPWDEETYISSMKPAFKQVLYRAALEEYHSDGRLRVSIRPFTKIEKMKATKYKAPRMIQARQPIFNIKYGRYIKALEHASIAHKKIGLHLGKGTLSQISQKFDKLRRKYSWYTEGDHKSFDAHVTPEHKRALHKHYQACFGHNSELRELSRKTINNKCRTLHGDSYTVQGTVMSGDVDTAYGNCRINLAILEAALDRLWIRGEAIVNGDDFVLFTDRPIPTVAMKSLLATFNMECELQPSTTCITDVSFCGSKLCMMEGGEMLLFHTPEKILDTFGMTHRVEVPRDKYLTDLATCFAYMEAHNPIGHAFAKAFNINVDPSNIPQLTTLETKLQYILSNLNIPSFSTGIITESMYRAYPSIDDWINKIHSLPSLIKTNTSTHPSSVYINHDNETIHVQKIL